MKKIILGFIFVTGCGIKGPPLPPLKEETVQSQKNWEEVEDATQPQPLVPRPTPKTPAKKKVKTE